jgi:hypothetical protein
MKNEFRLDGHDDDDPTATLLRQVLHREADAVQPSPDGLRRIRADIARQAPRPATRLVRRWTPMVAAAAVLALLAGAGGLVLRWRPHGSGQASAASGAIVATMDQVEAKTAPAATVPVYVVGHQGGRSVLFREFRSSHATDEEGMVEDAVHLAVTARPLDPHYTRLFAASPGTKVTARVTPAQIRLDISPAPKAVPGVTAADAKVALQQLVWTATATAAVAESSTGTAVLSTSAGYKQPGLRPVSIALGGKPGGALLGLAPVNADGTQGLVRHTRVRGYQDPRADVWIGDLAEDRRLPPGRQTVTGDAVSRADGLVHLLLLRDGVRMLDTTLPLGTSEESQFKAPPRPGERGHWSVDLDLSEPGSYTLVVWTGTGVPPGVSPGAGSAPPPAGQQTPASTVESDSKSFMVS